MSVKSLFMVGALAVCSLTIASAKSWDISLSSPAKAGKLELPKGDYSVKLNGNNVIFKAVDTGRTYTAPVKIETEARKYPDTAVESTAQGETEIIQCIDLGGSTSKIEFGE
ncbi:MAG TPA: hypothetical protein VLY04_04265 [Bryobacteraceae bacterium]|nr:hypothetical protein [Bryobacteraceae bacterium]